MFYRCDVITSEKTISGNVLKILAESSCTGVEIVQKLNMGKGGRLSSVLARLVEAGLVSQDHCQNPETGKMAREIRYRLKDNYSRFYLKYIEPMKNIIDAPICVQKRQKDEVVAEARKLLAKMGLGPMRRSVHRRTGCRDC